MKQYKPQMSPHYVPEWNGLDYATTHRTSNCVSCGIKIPKHINKLKEYFPMEVNSHNSRFTTLSSRSFCHTCMIKVIKQKENKIKEIKKYLNKIKRRIKNEDNEYVNKEYNKLKIIDSLKG